MKIHALEWSRGLICEYVKVYLAVLRETESRLKKKEDYSQKIAGHLKQTTHTQFSKKASKNKKEKKEKKKFTHLPLSIQTECNFILLLANSVLL